LGSGILSKTPKKPLDPKKPFGRGQKAASKGFFHWGWPKAFCLQKRSEYYLTHFRKRTILENFDRSDPNGVNSLGPKPCRGQKKSARTLKFTARAMEKSDCFYLKLKKMNF
jgi:hypothetical protein